jgi:hypothetical protein
MSQSPIGTQLAESIFIYAWEMSRKMVAGGGFVSHHQGDFTSQAKCTTPISNFKTASRAQICVCVSVEHHPLESGAQPRHYDAALFQKRGP